MLYAAGSQMFANQAQNMLQDFSHKGRSLVGQKLKYYFAVDTAYVAKKLALLFFPYSHKVSACVCLVKRRVPSNMSVGRSA